jgi:hypothetical protein
MRFQAWGFSVIVVVLRQNGLAIISGPLLFQLTRDAAIFLVRTIDADSAVQSLSTDFEYHLTSSTMSYSSL